MCDKCVELDKKIEHYWEITLAIGDELTIERIKALIGDLQAQMAHRPQNAGVALNRRHLLRSIFATTI